MHAPVGHALMGWVPYPPHMGPHFVGPITPFGLQKIKGKIEVEPNQASNLGQNQREVGQYVRLCVHVPLPRSESGQN